MDAKDYMKLALKEAQKAFFEDEVPVGVVIVNATTGQVVAKARNQTEHGGDPTKHAEMLAIQKACKKLKTHDLTGCELYTTAEPCPMCLCACMWANINTAYYGCTIEDSEKIGFRDKKFDNKICNRATIKKHLNCIDREECLKLFDEYANMKHTIY